MNQQKMGIYQGSALQENRTKGPCKLRTARISDSIQWAVICAVAWQRRVEARLTADAGRSTMAVGPVFFWESAL